MFSPSNTGLSHDGSPVPRKPRGLAVASGGAAPSSAKQMGGLRSPVAVSSRHRPAQYLSRLADVKQMDVQSALDQMKTLLSTSPHIVYKTSYYRKQTKNHWARDDPAFCALQVLFLIVSSLAYGVSFRSTPGEVLGFMVHSIVWNWLVIGVIIASLAREIANRHLTVHQSSTHVRQSVEWLYAFDIHCNAFFPLFVVLCECQFRVVVYVSFYAFVSARNLMPFFLFSCFLTCFMFVLMLVVLCYCY